MLAVACAGSQARVFVDVGCNLGWFSMLALAYRCDIVCVEPNPHLIAAIVCSAFLNRFTGSIIVVQAAAGAGAAVMELNIAIRHFGLSTLDDTIARSIQSQMGLNVVQVLAVGLGALLRAPADLELKINVEGSGSATGRSKAGGE